MEDWKNLLKTALIYLIALTGLILVVLFPRQTDVTASGGFAAVVNFDYQFSLGIYIDNITVFIHNLWETRSLGNTRYARVTVEDELIRYFPRTLLVIIPAFILSLSLGVLKGLYDYKNKYHIGLIIGKNATLFLQSVPDFFLILCFKWFFYLYLPFNIIGTSHWYSFIFPTILVSIFPMMYISRITTNTLANQEGQYYVQVAKSKGFIEKKVIYKHMFRNCIGTIVSHFTSLMVYIISNQLIVEYILDYEGAAYRLFTALGYKQTINVWEPVKNEDGLIIGIGISFLITVLVIDFIGFIVHRKFVPIRS